MSFVGKAMNETAVSRSELTPSLSDGKTADVPAGALTSLQANVAHALEHINIPSYLIDPAGVIRWINPAARRLVGDVEHRQFTSVVAPEETRRARELFARKLLGNVDSTDSPVVLVGDQGARIAVEISSVPLTRGDHVVGVFGQVSDVIEEPQPHPELHLTPRQAEVLRMLERGRTTTQIAEELHLSRETVRNHIRHLLHAVGAHSRLEAVALAHGEALATG
jgi:PAS domain S-box-containing protein